MELMQLIPPESISTRLPIVQHKCEIIKTDILQTLIPGEKLTNRLKRWLVRRCIVSRMHPNTKFYFKSNAAVNKEIIKHVQLHSHVIHPFSKFRKHWEIFMTVFTLFALIITPYFIAFKFNNPYQWIYVIFFINAVFFVDIVSNFFTGYVDSETRHVNLRRKIVFQKYVKTFFLLDLLSAFPYAVILIISSDDYSTYWTLFNIFMIFRIRNLIYYLSVLRKLHEIPFQIFKILQMFIIIFVCIHWATCLQMYFPLIGEKYKWARRPNQTSWIKSEFLKRRNTTFKMYVSCAKRAVVALTAGSHHLDVKTREDVLLNLFLTILGRIGVIYMLAQFSQLLAMFYSTKKKYHRSLQQLLGYMRYKELPRHVQKRILVYFNYWFHKSSKRDKMIISGVSPNLREELLLHKYSNLIKNIEFFKHLPHQALCQVMKSLKAEIYLTDDVLVKAGTNCDTMFYIVSGTAAVYSQSGKKVCHLEENSYFGEVGLVMKNEKRLATIIAMETCEVYYVHRDDFLNVINLYPFLINRLQKLVVGKLDEFGLHVTSV